MRPDGLRPVTDAFMALISSWTRRGERSSEEPDEDRAAAMLPELNLPLFPAPLLAGRSSDSDHLILILPCAAVSRRASSCFMLRGDDGDIGEAPAEQCQRKQTRRYEVLVGVPNMAPVSGFRCSPLGRSGSTSNSCSASWSSWAAVPGNVPLECQCTHTHTYTHKTGGCGGGGGGGGGRGEEGIDAVRGSTTWLRGTGLSRAHSMSPVWYVGTLGSACT